MIAGHLFLADGRCACGMRFGDISGATIERPQVTVDDAAVEKTIEILRKQRRTFQLRPASEGASEGDRVTIDFEGKIDGEPFAGGKAEAIAVDVGDAAAVARA